ncbi:hypothetical protein ASD44_11600 [Mesorhizobium sp. Root554]|uniref:DUF4167 domain-containing protein n=1 Tax=Mesorhizobium sp. Root1471 TaxID=1736469 RepID=UPI0006F55711|nr:DUF4167 domain-containing protein [Mesorhizobium sp. Root1471]KQZ14638.1 hypothetical protein ASD27_11610 [Mesorhizobium sp. Root1471]KQZ37146.1 hypothetical protein ASD44_11600 [Mesorhizobium sp. Root554]
MRGRNNGGSGSGNNNNNNNNNNRKGPNPLNRNYESNGPDVKIRGSAQQIAEKYATLARDATSSGDRVMAENYLQHAEHYNRIIAAAQAQIPIQNVQQNRDDFDDDGEEDRDDFDNGAAGGEGQGSSVPHGGGPQPMIDELPAEVALNSDNRNGNGRNRDRDRRQNGNYQNGQRNDYGARGDQADRNDADAGDERSSQNNNAQPAVEKEAQPRMEILSPAGLAAQAEANENAAENGAPRRARRPRRPRQETEPAAEAAAPGESGAEVASAES